MVPKLEDQLDHNVEEQYLTCERMEGGALSNPTIEQAMIGQDNLVQ